ncbi:hypothetical protein EV421DRAFT_1743133 [Armillaria borealis]|uniref:Uncharacterized protein n=1 Tax=Armillaria borealis TaxID=47425 RepID=A0AA39MEM2_9AGAR|nr:hypothetical protein EV421DRAFT_1743133 [Armillaria borealis]
MRRTSLLLLLVLGTHFRQQYLASTELFLSIVVKLKEWTVKYWRGNRPSPNSPHTPGGYSPVQESHLIDALWHNRSERRQIRSKRGGRCHHSCKSMAEVAEKQPLVLHWNGGLTLNGLVGINNYFFRRVLKMCKECPIDCVTSLVMSHARTLLIAYRHWDLFLQEEDCPPTEDIEDINRFIDQKVWERLRGILQTEIQSLMQRISEDAGIAGSHHWVLDVSMHQDGWYPWSCDDPEGEKQVGPEFDTEKLAQWNRLKVKKEEEKKQADEVTWPKPRMLSHHTGKRRALDDIPAEPSAVRPGSSNKDTALPAKRSRRKLMDDTDPDL